MSFAGRPSPGTGAQKAGDLDQIWDDLKLGIENVYDRAGKGIKECDDGTVNVVMSKPRYMQLYT